MNPTDPLQNLRNLDRASPRFHNQLSDFLREDEYRAAIPNLRGEGLTWLVEYLDSVLSNVSDHTSLGFREPLHEIGRICGLREVLPESCALLDYSPDTRLPPVSGTVHKGILGGTKVRVKRVRVCSKGDLQKARKSFYQTAVVWKHLTHTNVVPLLGVATDPLQLISDWMSSGNLMEYIASHPGTAYRPGLLFDVAEGLNYLHSCDVIHASLKGSNILVDATGRARLTDFGLAMLIQNMDSTEHSHNARWTAPEILDDRGMSHSKGTDVFSFGMVVIEAFTGAVPFGDAPPCAAMLAIVGGERPLRPFRPTLTDRLWALTQRCWNHDAHLRPQMSEVLETLRSFDAPAWKRLIDLPLTTDERVSLITTIFSDHDETEVVRWLRGDDAQSFVDVIDEALDNSMEPWLRKKCLNTLRRLCGRQALLPRSLQIPLCYNRTGTPLYHGGYADVWKGEHKGLGVAVKVLRVYSTSDLKKITRRFCNEVVTWKTLRHQNVLLLLGVTMDNDQFAMVSEWMDNGNINEFVGAHRDANRFELLRDVVQGLIYMHGEGMIHGDLKGANILIDRNSRACLADFGLLAIVSDPAYPTTSSSSVYAGTLRWMSPELLDPDQFGFKNGRPTKESDCYALGMVILEVLSSQVPFTCLKDPTVMRKVLEGEHPGRPQGVEGVSFTDDLWEMLKLCWSTQPGDRPSIETVLGCLEQVTSTWKPLPPNVGDDSQTDTDDKSSSTRSHPCQAATQGGGPSPASSQCHRRSVQDLEHAVTVGKATQACNSRPPSIAPGSTQPTIAKPRERIIPQADWDITQLLNVINNPLGPEWTLNALRAFTSSRNYVEVACMLDGEDAIKLVDVLDQAIGSVDWRRAPNMPLLRALSSICSATIQLPHAVVLSDGLEKCGGIAVVSGGFTDTWRGQYRTKPVAIKVLRDYPIQDLKEAKKVLWKELVVWKRLSHGHLLPFHGVDVSNFKLGLVYDWADCGNIVQYLDSHPKTSRTRLLREVAKGLQYLHSSGVVHGALKGSNVLISSSGRARLSDYGLMPIQSNHAFMIAATPGAVGISRWLAPELINPPCKKGHHQLPGTQQADIFAFAMLVIEVFTGALPFGDVRHETAILMIARGQRPEKPRGAESRGLTPDIWKFIQKCWNQNPTKRPSIGAIVNAWEAFDSQERLRGFVVTTPSTYQEKHQPRPQMPLVQPPGLSRLRTARTRTDTHLDRPKRKRWFSWFCILF